MNRHRNRWNGAIFAVLRRRDDLPEMPLLLALFSMAAVCVLMGLAGRCFSSAETAEEITDVLLSVIWGIPLLTLAVTCFALVILLWRRLSSLLAIPVSFGVILAVGGSLYGAMALCLILLAISYAFAVSLITRASPFHRQLVLALTTAVAVCLGLMGWVAVRFGGIAPFLETFMAEMPRWIGEQYTAMMQSLAGTDGAVILMEDAAREMARQILVSFPALLGMGAILLGWVTEFLTRQALRLWDCEADFLPLTEGISMPFAYAAVYLGSIFLTLFTSAEEHPVLHAAFLSILWIMALPCFGVGLRTAAWFLREKLYYVTQERLLSTVFLLLAFAILGFTPFVLLLSLVGAVRVLREKRPARRDEE